MSITYKEMKDQYYALLKTREYLSSKQNSLQNIYDSAKEKKIIILGCGSGFCLAQSAEMSAKVKLVCNATALAGGDLLLNYKNYENLVKDSIIIVPTRSGSTSEIVKALEAVKDSVYKIIAITCKEDSPISKVADITLELPWAFDESVCQTRTVSNLYYANLMVLSIFAKDTEIWANSLELISYGNEFMDKNEETLKEIAEESFERVVILADGEPQGIASEGAMAFIEITGIPAHFYHILDVRHGPMVLVDNRTLVLIYTNENGVSYQHDLIKHLKERNATVVQFDNGERFCDFADYRIGFGKNVSYELGGIPFIFLSQCISYYKSQLLGINPDAPQGLSAWVNL